MGKSILTITLLLLLNSILNAQWEILNEGFKGFLSTIDFVNENIGWVAGGNGTLLKTTDGGESWTSIAINENWNINQVKFINDSVGWAVGSMCDDSYCYGIIIKTNDGGSVWLVQKQVKDISFQTIYVCDEKNVCTIGDDKIFKTSDGGNSWADISPNLQDVHVNSLWFKNSDAGVVVGTLFGTTDKAIILRTDNGGNTWDKSVVDKFNSIRDLQFLYDTTGYFIANSDTIQFLCKTEDLLKSWEIKTSSTSWINSYQFLDSNTAYAIISDSLSSLAKSTDGGVSWINIQSFQYLQFIRRGFSKKIYFCDSKSGFLIDSYSISRTTDDGYSWETKKFSFPLTDTYFLNKNTGFAGGYFRIFHGSINYILSTTDGGNLWSVGEEKFGNLNSIAFFNDVTGFYLTGETIYKSSNSGSDWDPVYEYNFDSSAFYFWGNDICSMDNDITWAVGNYSMADTNGAGILGTFDGGKNWELIWKYPGSGNNWYDLNSIACSDKSCWAVGESGMVVEYTPETGWQKQTSFTDLPLKEIFFSDGNYGWITGIYQGENNIHSVLWKTTNGGGTWTDNNIDYLINDIWFINSQHGWMVGRDTSYYSKGVILETTDGGDNWTIVVDNLIGPLNSIFVRDNYAWAVGEHGLILRTTNAGITWIDDNDGEYPTEFILGQNYPNPFNPTTKIKYSFPSNVKRQTAEVKLVVYDILGREVATLVNEEKPAGEYEVEWNPKSNFGNLASGIYFYRLTAGHYIATKKMLLLK